MEKKLTRAEKAALKAYPTHKGASKEWIKHYLLGGDCAVFIKGYEQAEKDLVLTWKDIRKISRILDKIVDDDIKGKIPEEWGDEEYYEEVLRRFNKSKEEVK